MIRGGCLVFVALLLPACGDRSDPAERAEDKAPPVVLIGVDGVEWSVLAPLLREGRLPNLQRLVENGVAGRLYTLRPSLSPAIWTSVATGKRPEEHGIQHFLDKSETPYTSRQRRVRALWNIASQYDREVLCVGWWVTWPAEEIRGRMVAPFAASGQDQINWKGNLHPPDELPDQTWPRELIDHVYPMVEPLSHPQYLAERRASLFGDDLSTVQKVEQELVTQTLWSDLADESYTRITTALLGEGPVPDLTMVYLGSTDVASHRFWAYRHPDQFEFDIPEASVRQFNGVIEAFYTETDRRIGALLAALPDDVNVMVCSDHGFHSYFTERPSPLGISGHHLDGPSGVVILSGPDIASGAGRQILRGEEPPDLGRIYEVAPTVLRLMGLPQAEDLPGRGGGLLTRRSLHASASRRGTETVPSHDAGFEVEEERSPPPAATVAAMKEWMSQLGYMEGVGEDALFVEVLPEEGTSRARRGDRSRER